MAKPNQIELPTGEEIPILYEDRSVLAIGKPVGWMLVFKDSPIHGRGGFAKTAISKDTRIIEYVGERISKAESLRRCEGNNEYTFALSPELDLDGNVAWNPARLINHSCEPNCEPRMEDERVWIVAGRDIQPGEEITFNYGYDLEDYRDYPCRCSSPSCVGYIVAEEFFEHLRAGKSGPGSVSNLFPNLPVTLSNQFMQMFDLYPVEASANLNDWTPLDMPRLDFDGHQLSALLQDEIHFMTRTVAPIV